MTDHQQSGDQSTEPGSRSGEGVASVLPHLERQQQSQAFQVKLPGPTLAEMQAAASNAMAMIELLRADHAAALERGDTGRAATLAMDLRATLELARTAEARIAAALADQGKDGSSQE